MESLSPGDNKACILLGIWGEKFINDFLQLSLLSLLAPGNLPALTHLYKTQFFFLTRSYDVSIFEKHPAFQKLKNLCTVQFISINDLIPIGNYSTTLTLAYDRAIRQVGEQMLSTYFLFLTSDYIMADGSLLGLMRYMQMGYSGICAGNFQVVQEEIEPFLRSKIDTTNHTLQIKPRELLKESFQYLHPIVIASLYQQNIVHQYRANRFFLRPNYHTLAGRFYLLHMLCIKPETMDYRVGASCDYSFIPEMCPSGKIAILNDSDDYLVIEMQSKNHELDNIRLGSYNLKKLPCALAAWTTEQHRKNAQQTIYFHTEDISKTEKARIEKSLDNFMNPLSSKLLTYPAQSYYNHPYWFSAVQTGNPFYLNDYEYADITAPVTSSPKKWFGHLFGKPPAVFRWHHRWREYRTIRNLLQQHSKPNTSNNTIVLYDSYQTIFMHYYTWLKNSLNIRHHYYVQNLACSEDKVKELETSQFERCIILTRLGDLKNLKNTLTLINKMLTCTGKILILIPNDKNHLSRITYDFLKEFAYKINLIMHDSYSVTDITTIHDNFSLAGSMAINTIRKAFDYNKKLQFLFYVLAGIPGGIMCFIRHCLPRFANRKKGHCTDVVITLAPNNEYGEIA